MKLLKFAQAKCKMYIIQSKKDGRYYSFIYLLQQMQNICTLSESFILSGVWLVLSAAAV